MATMSGSRRQSSLPRRNRATMSPREQQTRKYSWAKGSAWPGSGSGQALSRLFGLEAILEGLTKDAVVIPQAIPHRRDFQGGERLDEAGREAAQPAVAQSGVRFGVNDFGPILMRIRLQVV